MKRRAVRLVTAWMLERDVPDWVEFATHHTLIDDDMAQWQSFLVLARHPEAEADAVGVTWCLTLGVHFMHCLSMERLGLDYFTVPVADILDGELEIQLLEFLCEPDWFDADHPAPVDIVDCGAR